MKLEHVVLSLKIDDKNMVTAKVQSSGKINIERKKLVERKRTVISASTGSKRVSPYMVSLEGGALISFPEPTCLLVSVKTRSCGRVISRVQDFRTSSF